MGQTHSRSGLEETSLAGFPAVVGRPAPVRAETTPVVFLHGAFADHHCFAGWVQPFADRGYPGVAASRRGRLGVGPENAGGLTFDDYVDDTLAVIEALPPTPAPIVVGHSLGGLLAQRLAEQGRVEAMVLLASAPPAVLTAQAGALPRFAPSLGKILTGRPFMVGHGACQALALNRVPEDRQAAIHAHLTPESGKVYRSMMLGTVRVDPSKVRVPVFVAGAGDDRIISARLTRRTARHYGVEPRLYEGHGHWLLEEPGWERIADDVLAWLADAIGRGPAAGFSRS